MTYFEAESKNLLRVVNAKTPELALDVQLFAGSIMLSVLFDNGKCEGVVISPEDALKIRDYLEPFAAIAESSTLSLENVMHGAAQAWEDENDVSDKHDAWKLYNALT